MSNFQFDLVVLGAGPGGYVSAIRATQLGMKVAIVEKDKLGGVCLNIGCIPSKALIKQAKTFRSIKSLEGMGLKIDQSEFDYTQVFKKSRKASDVLSRGVALLMKNNKIEVITGEGKIKDAHTVSVNGEQEITAKNILVATGSRPMNIPGFEANEDDIISSNGALMLEKLPESMLVLGGGVIGVEMAYIFSSFGVKIHMVEMLPHLLPNEDSEIAATLERLFKRNKIKISCETRALSCERVDGKLNVKLQAKDGKEEIVTVEKVLVSVGRRPNTESIGLENIDLKTDRGFIPVQDYYQTVVPSVYAIGDVVMTPLLAHVASKEGEIAVEHMAGHSRDAKVKLDEIPSAVYCEPQVASFGITEDKLIEAKRAYKKVAFPFRAIGKAVATEESDGMVKILVDENSKEILGAHLIGPEVTELLHEILLAKSANLRPEHIAQMIHAHPSLSEGVMEAMKAIEGEAIHGG